MITALVEAHRFELPRICFSTPQNSWLPVQALLTQREDRGLQPTSLVPDKAFLHTTSGQAWNHDSPPVRLGLMLDFMSAVPPPPSPRPPPPPPDLNWKRLIPAFPRRTRTASAGSECSPPDLNCKRYIAVFPAGTQQQAQDQSVPRRTSTASARSQCSPPDPNSKLRIRVFPAGPQLQALDRSKQAQDQSVPLRTSAASARAQCYPPDPNSNLWIKMLTDKTMLWVLQWDLYLRVCTRARNSSPSLDFSLAPFLSTSPTEENVKERMPDRMSE